MSHDQPPRSDIPLRVKCPKCGAAPGVECNPHRDLKTAAPIYREPHRRRWDAARIKPRIDDAEEETLP